MKNGRNEFGAGQKGYRHEFRKGGEIRASPLFCALVFFEGAGMRVLE
jgi:hypothetical protein